MILIPCNWAHIQFWVHIKASNILGWSLLQCGLRNRPLVLKEDSEATVETGIANMSLAISDKIGYFVLFTFHHIKFTQPLPKWLHTAFSSPLIVFILK